MTATVLAQLTPPGKAAIATLAVRGPSTWEAVGRLFQPCKGTLPEQPEIGRHWFGKLAGDDVILAVHPDWIELHCHGGVEVVRVIEEAFQQLGVSVVAWQQFVDAPALLDLLVHAPTVRTASILLDQWQGAWNDPAKLDSARLEQLRPVGGHLVTPWKVLLAGAPNVGKSSLMNALVGYTRSIVSPIPGTTRDVVSTTVAIDGWPIDLIDTAGMRMSPTELERQGIERAQEAGRDADLRFWLLDGAAEPMLPEQPDDWQLLINKADLPPAWDWQRFPEALPISALTGLGVAELCDWISRRLVPSPPLPGEAVPCVPGHFEWMGSRSAPAPPAE